MARNVGPLGTNSVVLGCSRSWHEIFYRLPEVTVDGLRIDGTDDSCELWCQLQRLLVSDAPFMPNEMSPILLQL